MLGRNVSAHKLWKNFCSSSTPPLWPRAGSSPPQQSQVNQLNYLWVFWLFAAITYLHCTFIKHIWSLLIPAPQYSTPFITNQELIYSGWRISKKYSWITGDISRLRISWTWKSNIVYEKCLVLLQDIILQGIILNASRRCIQDIIMHKLNSCVECFVPAMRT